MQRKSLPHLDIVPLRALILHEDVEDHRVDGIMRRFLEEEVVKNPPIVGENRGRHLIVLDGASRVTAARRLGFPHLLVQVVKYPSPEIKLDRWHHLVAGLSLDALAAEAARIPGTILEPVSWTRAREALEAGKALACLRAPRRRPVLISGKAGAGLRPIRELTTLYATDPGLHRVREDQVAFPEEWLGADRVLVLFPRFRQQDIVRFALREKDRLPMGITRHTVPNRALRVYYPVEWLIAPTSLVEKRRELREFLERKWERGAIRFYPEPTTVYDE